MTEITLEIISDAICPWCWIGKRHLEAAEKMLDGKIRIRRVWKPFELNPDMPKEGVPRDVYRTRKFGSLAFSQQLDAQVRESGAAAGLDFRHELMEWTPNTVECHRLIWLAGREGDQDAVVEGLFRAYFHEGRNIGDPAVMHDVALDAGFDKARINNFLQGKEGIGEVSRELAAAREMGVSGVPSFMIGGELLFSGAVPAQMIMQAITDFAEMEK